MGRRNECVVFDITLADAGEDRKANVSWINHQGQEKLYFVLHLNEAKTQHTCQGHRWVVRGNPSGKVLSDFAATGGWPRQHIVVGDATAAKVATEKAAMEKAEQERIAAAKQPLTAASAKVRALFAEFDRDGNGYLTADELTGVLMRPGGGEPMSESDALAFIANFDTNSDGKLSLEELSAALAEIAMSQMIPPKPVVTESPAAPVGDEPLAVMVARLKSELGLDPGLSIVKTVDAACAELGIDPNDGNLVDRARKATRVMVPTGLQIAQEL